MTARNRSTCSAIRPLGFTLVEMLVVIAVVAVLTGLLLTAVRGARQTAQSVACQSNLRTFATALAIYRGVHKDLMPLATSSFDIRSNAIAPFAALHPYLSVPLPKLEADGTISGTAPFRCPADTIDFADTGSSYFYMPFMTMAGLNASYGQVDAARLYTRHMAESPQEEFFVDVRPIHFGNRNILLSTGLIVTK